jgi:hypothetical protein
VMPRLLPMSEQTLTSLAVLTVNWDRGHDLIASFLPLVASCIPLESERPLSLVDLQEIVKDRAGIKIPSGALEVMLHRCAKQGLIRRTAGAYLPNMQKLEKLDYQQARGEALRQHKCLLDKLGAFAQERYGLDWSEIDADKYVLNFLQEGSVPVLLAAIEGDPLPPFRAQSAKSKHVVSAFALHLHETDPEGFRCLETVAKGHILSGVLFYPDIGQVEMRFTDLDVYCDTPVLLPALGYAEEGVYAQCLDLIELLRDLGARMRCFHHTREEVVGVLEAIAASHRPGGMKAAEPRYYATSRKFSLSDVEEMIVTIDATLERLGIEVVDTPEWTARPDEASLEERLGKEINYARERAKEKDAQSLAAIARLRGLRRMEKFESAKAIFVTRNAALARVSSRFFKDLETGRAIPIAMPVNLMTRLAWVKKPTVAPNLPRHAVMAASYAALNPEVRLWRRYLKEIDKRRSSGDVSDAEYHVLRSSREARVALMDKTFGNEDAFSAGTVDEVLAHSREVIQAEAAAETEAEREGRQGAELGARRERDRRENLEQLQRDKVRSRAKMFGAVLGWSAAVILGPAVVIGAVATVPGVPLLEVGNVTARIALWVCFVAFFGLTLFAILIKHVPLRAVRRAISEQVAGYWTRRGHQRLGKLHAQAAEKAEAPRDSSQDND